MQSLTHQEQQALQLSYIPMVEIFETEKQNTIELANHMQNLLNDYKKSKYFKEHEFNSRQRIINQINKFCEVSNLMIEVLYSFINEEYKRGYNAAIKKNHSNNHNLFEKEAYRNYNINKSKQIWNHLY